MQALQSLFTFDTERQVLIAYDKQEYERLNISNFEVELAIELQDPPFAKQIANAYKKHLWHLLTDSQRNSFQKAVVETVLVFGSSKYSPQAALEKVLKSNNFQAHTFASAIEDFINDTVRIKPPQKSSSAPRICLLHTTASGGNSSVTRALQAFLESRGSICQSIDVETLATEHDSMKKATGYTFDGVYAEFFQKKNSAATPEGLDLVLRGRAILNKRIAAYILPRTQEILKEKIATFTPTLIISTRSYCNDDINLAYSLDVPMKFVYCDYDLFITHCYLGKTNPNLFQFWMPRLNARTFTFALTSLDKNTEHSVLDSWQTVAKRISHVVAAPLQEITSTFCEIGYPVGKEYSRIVDPQKLAELRTKWDVKIGEHLVIVTMGKNGVGVIEDIFKTLAKSPSQQLSTKYVFVCGSNDELFANLSTYAKKHDLSSTALKRVQILGFISHADMGELMNICSIICSKPGGGTAAQCREMNVPLFSMHAHKLWESGNERELTDAGLNYIYDPKQELTTQIEHAIAFSNLLHYRTPVTNWKARVLQYLE